MDSHYHQVMKAREAVQDSATRFYFAYSTVLDQEAFEVWRREHSYEFFNLPEGRVVKALNTDLIFDFPSRWWGGLAAGLVEKEGSVVYGKVFEIAAKDWPVVQHKEGFITGMCIEKNIKVEHEGVIFEATAFTTSPERARTEGTISPRFMEALIRGAQQAQLPEDYILKLKQISL